MPRGLRGQEKARWAAEAFFGTLFALPAKPQQARGELFLDLGRLQNDLPKLFFDL